MCIGTMYIVCNEAERQKWIKYVFTNTKHYNGFCSYLNEIIANQS